LRDGLLLWLGGFAIRAPLLAVPPLLPVIARQLGLSHTAIGLLTGLPVILFAATAVIGSLLLTRLGLRRALALALLMAAAGGALRGLGGAATVLFGMTVVMGVGIALAQPAMVALAARSPHLGGGRATGLYSNGMLVGEVVAVAASVPLAAWLGGWGGALGIWSLPVLGAVAAVLAWTPREAPAAVATAWWPDWRSRDTWRLGLILGCSSVMYQVCNAFIPGYLAATGRAGLVAATLTSLNLIQVFASLVVAALPGLVGRSRPIVIAGACTLASLLALVALPFASAVVIGAGLLGCSASAIFVLGLALPPVLAPRDQVGRLSAGMFTISYTCGFSGLLLGGQLGDRLGAPAAPLLPVGVACLVVMVLAAGLGRTAAPARQPVAVS
jgi:CP family cyanate transporter-like MFS transporter